LWEGGGNHAGCIGRKLDSEFKEKQRCTGPQTKDGKLAHHGQKTWKKEAGELILESQKTDGSKKEKEARRDWIKRFR